MICAVYYSLNEYRITILNFLLCPYIVAAMLNFNIITVLLSLFPFACGAYDNFTNKTQKQKTIVPICIYKYQCCCAIISMVYSAKKVLKCKKKIVARRACTYTQTKHPSSSKCHTPVVISVSLFHTIYGIPTFCVC